MSQKRYRKGDVVDSNETLWRHITPEQWNPEREGNQRILSSLFITAEMSVDVESLTTLEKSLMGCENNGVASFDAEVAFALGSKVIADPCPPENPANDAHAIVTPKLSQKKARRLRKKVTVEKEPDPVEQ